MKLLRKCTLNSTPICAAFSNGITHVSYMEIESSDVGRKVVLHPKIHNLETSDVGRVLALSKDNNYFVCAQFAHLIKGGAA